MLKIIAAVEVQNLKCGASIRVFSVRNATDASLENHQPTVSTDPQVNAEQVVDKKRKADQCGRPKKAIKLCDVMQDLENLDISNHPISPQDISTGRHAREMACTDTQMVEDLQLKFETCSLNLNSRKVIPAARIFWCTGN